MAGSFDPEKVAQHIAQAHASRTPYRNLPPDLAPQNVAQAYQAQAALARLLAAREGRVAGLKIATTTMIADNCWNAGVVLGAETAFDPARSVDGMRGSLQIDGRPAGEGRTDNPLGALAWVANLANEHGRSLEAGMIVITGSIVPTFPVEAGNRVVFQLEGFGTTELLVK